MLPTFTLSDGREVKLGKLPPDPNWKGVHLRDHLRGGAALPDISDFISKAAPAIDQMYGNNTKSDCVVACLFHDFGIWTGNELGVPAVGTTAKALSAYNAICGPGDPGCVITNVLDVAKTKGVTIGGNVYKISDYVAVDWQNQAEVQTAILAFGCVTIGCQLPTGWMNSSTIWDVVTGDAAVVLGGHCIAGGAYATPPIGTIFGFNATGVVIATWGGLRLITWPAFLSTTWIDECWGILAPSWTSQGLDPLGVNVATLEQALADFAAGTVPPVPIGPTPTPVPPPTPVPTPTAVPDVAIFLATKTVEAHPESGLKFVKSPIAENQVVIGFGAKQVTLHGAWRGQEVAPTAGPDVAIFHATKTVQVKAGLGMTVVHVTAPLDQVLVNFAAKQLVIHGLWTGQQA